MNAPLPKEATESAANIYERVSHNFNEVAGKLASRLSSETQGEVLFGAADRGRYATDASIYQVKPVGVFVPRSANEVPIAMAICRDLGVPIVPRGGGTSQCGQTTGAGLVIDHTKYIRNVLEVDPVKRTVEVEPGMHKPLWAAWPATTHAAVALLRMATWCTTCWAPRPG